MTVFQFYCDKTFLVSVGYFLGYVLKSENGILLLRLRFLSGCPAGYQTVADKSIASLFFLIMYLFTAITTNNVK